MLSSRNELFAIGALVVYIAFGPCIQPVRDILSTSVGKAAALAGIVYVHQKVSCSVALLLLVWYVRCSRNSWEGFTTPTTAVPPIMTCPDGYAYDSISKECKATSSMSGSVPPSPTGSSMGASVTAPPPNSRMSTAPMTTPMPTMPPVTPPITSGGVQPATSNSSSSAGV